MSTTTRPRVSRGRTPGPGRHRRPGRVGRARWLVPALLLLGWLVLAGTGGPFAGRLAEVQTNDNASFLPTSAESTRVVELQARFAEEEVLPAIVVYERAGGIGAEDLAAAAADAEELAGLDGVVGQVSPPIPSEDGAAAQVLVPLDADLGDGVIEKVERIREVVSAGLPAGTDVYVTGPGGILADFAEAFGEIDGLLLLVATSVVLGILLLVYRSPLLPLVVLSGALFALAAASALVYVLADNDLITLNGQSQGILFILVVGAATDYALLLVARYREELREHESRYDAMRVALRQSFEPILASGSTVILGLLCLLFSDLNSNKGLGPVAAIGIACSLLMAFTFLPAALVLLGRSAFWPFSPAYGSEHRNERGIWARVAALVGRRPRAVWLATSLGLAFFAAFLPTLRADGIAQTDLFLTEVESVAGQEALTRHYPGGTGSPAVVIGPAERLEDIVATTAATQGVAAVLPSTGFPAVPGGEPRVVDGLVEVNATLADPADSEAAVEVVERLRADLDAVDPGVLVGGVTAIQLDTRDTARSDLVTILPIVLLVILAVLVALLRAVVAPLLLVATVVLSFAATLGVSAILFNTVFDFPGSDPAVPLFGFVFLVALGIDYNIFLMTRVREESMDRGTRPGILFGLTVTGGVITSAGVVLAATFAALSVLPILFLVQIAFIVAFGVLLDALVVRSLLVPALSYDIGARIWWPSRLARAGETADGEPAAGDPETAAAGGAAGDRAARSAASSTVPSPVESGVPAGPGPEPTPAADR